MAFLLAFTLTYRDLQDPSNIRVEVKLTIAKDTGGICPVRTPVDVDGKNYSGKSYRCILKERTSTNEEKQVTYL